MIKYVLSPDQAGVYVAHITGLKVKVPEESYDLGWYF